MSLKYQKDRFNKKILLSDDNQQVMMEWEKMYMEKSIDLLHPTGHVLEIGFGLGYSATRIQSYKPESYTVIECDEEVIKEAKKWANNFNNVTIIEGRWQEKLSDLGCFDEIFFDDFPLVISKTYLKNNLIAQSLRFPMFLEICILYHTKVGSKISGYLNNNRSLNIQSNLIPYVKLIQKNLEIDIPENCNYRNLDEQKCSLFLIEKVKEIADKKKDNI